MGEYQSIERNLQQTLRLERRPVAITFCDSVPAGVPAFTGVEPSSCSYWRLASSGRAFYTVASDHYNCPVGAYTHNVPLPPDRAGELQATLGGDQRIRGVRAALGAKGVHRALAGAGQIAHRALEVAASAKRERRRRA